MKTSILLFLVSLALFTFGLPSQEIINFDARFYLFAQEMWRHGPSWFPTTYGQPYPDYPALSTFLVYLSALIFGGLTKLTAVLPSAIAAALTVVVTYHIGRLHDKKLGFYAVLMLFCTLAFFKSARSISLDMYPTLITACCFYLVCSADQMKDAVRLKWVYPLLALSFIFRGPIGLVMPTGVVCIYYLQRRNIRQFLVVGGSAFLILLLCLATLLLLAYHVGGLSFVQDVMRMEVTGRMGNYFQPIYFYFTDSLASYALSYPLALLVMIGLLLGKKEDKFFLLLMGWVLVIMVGMSIPTEKKVRYILPMAPAIALLAASLFAIASKQKYLCMVRYTAMAVLLFLPGLLSLATYYAAHLAPRYNVSEAVSFLPLIVFFAVMQAGALYCYITDVRAPERRLAFVVFLGTVCFVATNLFIIEPIELHIDRTRDFVRSVEGMRLQKNARLGFYRENSDEMPIKYLINRQDEERPLFIASETDLQSLQEPVMLVSSTEYFNDLSLNAKKHCRVLSRGRIGHAEVIIFEYDK